MKKFSKGMTLVEVILAMGIISIVSVGVLSMFTMSAWVMSGTEEKLQSTYTGQEMMEIMYHYAATLPFDEIIEELKGKDFQPIAESSESDTIDWVKMERGKEDEFPIKIAYSKDEFETLLQVEIIVYSDREESNVKSQYQAFFPLKKGGSDD